MTHILTVEKLSAGYFDRAVVSDISFSVGKGEFIGIIGPNGAGKSTLIKTMTRTLKPFSGAIRSGGGDIYDMPPDKVARSIAVVPQDTLIVFEFLVWDIVMMGRIPHVKKFKKIGENDLAVVEKCLGLTDTKNLTNRLINELSAGERQRVIIAKALAQEPEILMLDEPTSHLDISHQVEIFDLLKGLSEKNGLTVISVLHDLNLASEYCDRLLLINDGRLFSQGRPQEVLTYKNIEEVYKTVVVVKENPISKKPYIFLVSQNRLKEREITG